MLINNNYSGQLAGKTLYANQINDRISEKTDSENKKNQHDERLKILAGEFASILIKQMFKSMRNSIWKSDLIDAGFSEDVFTDMLDEEISKKSSSQQGFNNLGRILYEQLKRNS